MKPELPKEVSNRFIYHRGMTEQQRINNIITNVLADARDEIIRLIENPRQKGEKIGEDTDKKDQNYCIHTEEGVCDTCISDRAIQNNYE